jgi:hypothetical protein
LAREQEGEQGDGEESGSLSLRNCWPDEEESEEEEAPREFEYFSDGEEDEEGQL